MSRERESPGAVDRLNVRFKDFKVHSDKLDDYFDSDEPSNRVKAESDGTQNKADVAFRQMVEGDTFPNYKNAGLRKNVDRRYK